MIIFNVFPCLKAAQNHPGAALRALKKRSADSGAKSHGRDGHDGHDGHDVKVIATEIGKLGQQGLDEDQIRELFNLFDIDNNTYIKAWEMQDVLTGLGFQAGLDENAWNNSNNNNNNNNNNNINMFKVNIPNRRWPRLQWRSASR